MGLTTLRNGFAEGTLVTSAAILLAGIAMRFFMGTPDSVIVFTILTGLPVLLLAATLRRTRSLATTITVAGLCAAAGVVALHAAIEDPLLWWRNWLYAILITPEQTSIIDAQNTENLERLVDALAPMMMTALPAGIMFGTILVLFLARWWHAILDNPGGFRNEFHGLRFDPRLAITAIIIGGIAMIMGRTSGIGNGFLQILVILYLFQGLAVSHGIVAMRGVSGNWLVALYLLLILIPNITTSLLAITGLMDAFFDFRARATNKQGARKP